MSDVNTILLTLVTAVVVVMGIAKLAKSRRAVKPAMAPPTVPQSTFLDTEGVDDESGEDDDVLYDIVIMKNGSIQSGLEILQWKGVYDYEFTHVGNVLVIWLDDDSGNQEIIRLAHDQYVVITSAR